ncbi:MAG: ubiquinone/menaquinone biosynthesis methyltransferase [Candidatus Methanomethylophilaceae archaeon]|jgi:demethylmenaquinone methyltransferase/2-methoxy-6-polyprenyl-1,4-benzoquinol methylase
MKDNEQLGIQFEGKDVYVKDVFTEISSYYDEMNDIMSMGMIKRWHKFMMKKLGDLEGKKCLDVGTGTGEIAFLMASRGGNVTGIDLTPAMIELAEKKMTEKNLPKADLMVGDALDLPFEEGTFDCVTSGYMLRNVTDIPKAVSEMCRVLKSGGICVVAELARPTNRLIRPFYNFYMNRIIPRYGRKYDKGQSIDGREPAYDWLTASIEGFPYGKEMTDIFLDAGFDEARFFVKSFGAVNIYEGIKK